MNFKKLFRWTRGSQELSSRPVNPELFRAVFLHLPKTAGTSVRHVISRHDHVLCDVKQQWLGWNGGYTYKEFSDVGFASAIRQRLGEDIWDRCFKFAFVRNPWDRAVSNWKYLKKVVPIGDFEDFISRLEDKTLRYSPRDNKTNSFLWHVEPLHSKLVDATGNLMVDFVGRLENLQTDFDEICDTIGIERVQIPQLNTTQHRHYSEYYDERSIQRVAELYTQDIEYFRYTFDLPLQSNGLPM